MDSNLIVPIKKLEEYQLILREHIASATMGDDKFDVSLSFGTLIFDTPKAKYSIKIEDMLQRIIKMEQEGLL